MGTKTKNTTALLVAILLCSMCCAARRTAAVTHENRSATTAPLTAAKQTIILDGKWTEAEVKQDANALRGLLDEPFSPSPTVSPDDDRR